MVKKYIDALSNDLQQIFQDEDIEFNAYVTTEYTDLEMMSDVFKDEYPKLVFSMENSYICDDSITEYKVVRDGQIHNQKVDYKEGLLIKPIFYVNVVSDDPSHNADIEDLLLAAYATGREIFIDYDLDYVISVSIKRMDSKIIRKKLSSSDKNVLVSTICLEAINSGFVLCEKPHPAKVAFDPMLQIEVLEKLVSYNDLCDYYYNKLPFQIIDKINGYTPEPEEIENERIYKRIKETSDELLKSTEVLDAEHSNPFYVKSIYEIMHEKQYLKLEEAIKYFDDNKETYSARLDKNNEELEKNRREKSEKEKELYVLERYQEKNKDDRKRVINTVGDPEINRYIDAVIPQIKDIVEADIEVFGGSSYMNYYRKRDNKEISFPCILIQSNIFFMEDCNYNTSNYKLYTSDGIVNEYKYDYLYYLPGCLKIALQVIYDGNSQQMASLIKNKIASTYQNGRMLYVGIPNNENMFTCLELKTDSIGDAFIESSVYTVNFCEQKCVYFAFDNRTSDILYDSRYQLSLLKRIVFYKRISVRLQKAIDSISSDYQKCFDGKFPDGLDRKKGEKYLELKQLYNKKLFISKESFDEGLSKIVQIYTDLYDDFNNGQSVDTIISKIKSNKEKVDNNHKNICDTLKIPDQPIGEFQQRNYRDTSRINDYIKALSEDEFTIIENDFFEVYKIYFVLKEKKREEKLRSSLRKAASSMLNNTSSEWTSEEDSLDSQMGIMSEYQQDSESEYTQVDYDETSEHKSHLGLGLIGGAAVLLAGHAVSHHFRNKTHDYKNEKKDLLGTPQCPKGKKDRDSYITGQCDMSCPVSGYCTRY